MSNDHDDQDLSWLNPDPAPRDIVPGAGLTLADVRRMNDATGKAVEGVIPGEVILDVDGIPLAVTESRTTRATFGGAAISRAEAHRLGVTPDEYPNITIIEGNPHHD